MLKEQNIDVNLLPLNQQEPESMGPAGRVSSVRNAIVKKFSPGGSGPRLRIEKRPGMTPLSTDAFANGTAIASPSDPKILASWKDQLFLLGGPTPYVYSEAKLAWERPSNVYTTAPQVAPYKLSKGPLYSASSRAYAPDVASVGNVFCRAVADSTYGPQIIFVDAEGVQIRAPLSAAGTPTKVVSDGTQFWVYSQGATSTEIKVYDTAGVLLASSSIAWGVARAKWDVGYQSTTGTTYLVTPTGATLTVIYSTYAAGVITNTTYTPAADVPSGVARLEPNGFGGTNIYVAGQNVAGDVIGYRITSGGVIAHTYAIASTLGFVGNIAGFVANSSLDITVALGILQNNSLSALVALNNQTLVYTCTAAGASSLSVTQRSVAPVSRAFADADGVYRVWTYYQSQACFTSSGSIKDISMLGSTPSFFSMNISATVPMIDGQIEIGSAYAFYATSRNSIVFTPWALASIAVDLDGVQHVPLGTLGVQVPTLVTSPFTGFTAVTVISDYRMSPWPGEALATSDSLMLPGFQSMSFDGSNVVESGIHTPPEIIAAVAGGGGNLTPNETVNYVVIWRTTDAAGNVIRSAPSAVLTIDPVANTKVTLTIATLRTTARLTVVGEVYRTFDPTGGATEGTELRLVGTFANTILADTATFVDTASDTDAEIGTECYAQVLQDNPELDHFPPPAHSSGINFQDRSMVVGFDGAIWISSSRIDGEVPWYNPLMRIMLPSGATPSRLVPMDTRVIVMCAGGELWAFPGGGLPNATLTSGALPTPEQVPFTTGARGPAAMTPLGAVYAAERGIWLMDRAISQAFIGSGVLDEVSSESAPTGIVANDDQRLYFLMSEDGNPSGATSIADVLVYDFVTGSWWIWGMPTFPAFATIWKGRFTWVDFDCKVWREDLPETSTYTDDGAAITTVIGVASMTFDGASGFQRLWGLEIFGEWKGSHVLAAAFTYDNAAAASEVLTMPAGVDPGEYRYEVRQEKQKNIAVAIEFSDSFVWSTLATMQTVSAAAMIVDDVTNLRVGSSYSTRTGSVLDSGTFEVVAIIPASKRVEYIAAGGWVGIATHEIIPQTDSLDPGNSFTLESVELRIGVKGGLGRLPTQRRMM